MEIIAITTNKLTLSGLSKINILLGKNGCGKSTVLRDLVGNTKLLPSYNFQYLPPERGGTLKYQASYQDNMKEESWAVGQRNKNQSGVFRAISAVLFRDLEMSVLRLIEKERRADIEFTFDQYVKNLNSLLDQIRLERHSAGGFKIFSKKLESEISEDKISSGEAELISLGIECLSFVSLLNKGKENILLIDEPDVHLHPDLQERFMNFLIKLMEDANFRVIITTHSTPILSAVTKSLFSTVCFMRADQANMKFRKISNVLETILPIFGASPLSSVFSKMPVFIVEGTDEERIWQQAVRSSHGKIKINTVETGGVGNIDKFEKEADEILSSVYDSAKGFSLRDGDGINEELQDLTNVIRFRLLCYSSENLMLSDEVLKCCGVDWLDLKQSLVAWMNANANHKDKARVSELISSDDRKNCKIKDIRNIIAAYLSPNKPWEVLVGQTIAQLAKDVESHSPTSIYSFLGIKLCKEILP